MLTTGHLPLPIAIFQSHSDQTCMIVWGIHVKFNQIESADRVKTVNTNSFAKSTVIGIDLQLAT